MLFKIKNDADLEMVKSGDQVTERWSSTICPPGSRLPRSSKWARFQRLSTCRRTKPGTEVPDFGLVNQDGKRIHLRSIAARRSLLTFVYTRCPQPDQCTLMSNNSPP